MKPSAPVFSDMPGPKTYIGWWGAMGAPKHKGVTQYAMSPYRQSAFRGAFSGYLFHGARRLGANAPYFVPPFALGYAVYSWAKAKDHYNNSKQAHIQALKDSGEHHGH